jgi:DNA-directed RNA polymerase specialized sigma24 family protein
MNLGTVKSRLSRGRAKMREYLLAHREQLPRSVRL